MRSRWLLVAGFAWVAAAGTTGAGEPPASEPGAILARRVEDLEAKVRALEGRLVAQDPAAFAVLPDIEKYGPPKLTGPLPADAPEHDALQDWRFAWVEVQDRHAY